MLELRFELEGQDLLLRNLGSIEKDMTDWRDTFAKTGSFLKKTFRENFYVQGTLLEKQWARLKQATIDAKIRKGYAWPGMPLLGTGKMSESFKSEAGKYHVRVHNPIEYFKYHQSHRPRTTNLPRRVMISLTEKMKKEIIMTFQQAIDRKLMKRYLV